MGSTRGSHIEAMATRGFPYRVDPMAEASITYIYTAVAQHTEL